MSNDNKTLADAQPGGRVRLGDALLPCPFCGAPAERIDFGIGSGENEGGSCIACTVCQHSGPIEFGYKENFVSNWNRRALSAQPSPGGQDALASLPLYRLADDANGNRGLHRDDTGSWVKLQDVERALAARQPVGEPVAWVHEEDPARVISARQKATALRDQGASGSSVRPHSVPAYLQAPTAQAVGLAPVMIPDTPEVRDILGRPNFWCSPWANVLRMRGDPIPRKAEEEQAAVIRFMLNHYLANGADWAETAGAELDAIRKADSQAVSNG